MKKYKIASTQNPTLYANCFSKQFINYDIPNLYFEKDGKWILVIDGRYGVLTEAYCELEVSFQKEILLFIVKSAKAF